MTAYEILGVAKTASDIEIKQAYLRQVKENPPDRDQDKFQLIHDAYSAIKDHKSRVSYELFTLHEFAFDEVINQALQTDESIVNFSGKALIQLLRVSADEKTLSYFVANP